MLNTDKEWIPFMEDIDRAIKTDEISINEKRVLKDIRRIAKKKGHATINQFLIACEILDELDTKKETGNNSEND